MCRIHTHDCIIWEVVHVYPHVGLRAHVLSPLLMQIYVVFARDFQRTEEVGDFESSGKDDDIKLLANTRFTCDTSGIHLRNAFWDKAEILCVQSFKIAGIENPAFATY